MYDTVGVRFYNPGLNFVRRMGTATVFASGVAATATATVAAAGTRFGAQEGGGAGVELDSY